jgi:hypothetical protein
VNANVTLSLTHNSSTRLSFYVSVYAVYQTEPDFKSDVGPENVRADHFETSDIFSVTYHWLPQFATITSYTFRRIKYDESSIGAFQDRVQNTLGEVFQFSRSSRTNLVGEYRFEMISYDTAPSSSVTHFVLAGFEHKLTEHLTLNARGGETFRSYDIGMDTVDPYFEGSLRFGSPGRSLNWTASYGTEEPNVPGALARTTFRTGVELTYGLSARISSTAAVYYHHDENEGLISPGTGSGGSQDSFDLTLGLRYTINQHFALHIDYSRSSVGSLGSTPGYSRNRYFAGLSFTF